ncbi:hypothetical protein QJS04_geneDACA002748 [Acorus gramineus]|uniref:Uncharacterized protein n=1 Tax=Acorus gramineus TaxID=55184 RepID=A0AAV9BUL2_ACOGR|nr:hypothetical protein QJS04_geneDACA002748 [Acorus gramineus]
MDNVKETLKRGRVGASTTENEFTQKVHIAISEEKIPSPTESIGGVEGDDLNEDEGHQSAVKDPISRALYNARLEGQVISQSLESGLEVKELEFQEANQLGIIEKQDETVEENLGGEIEVMDMDMVQLSDLPINSTEEKQEMDEINAEGSSSPVTEKPELYNTELMVTEEEEEKEMRVGDEHTPVH